MSGCSTRSRKDPSEKAEIIDALRTRGIGFVLTDGLAGWRGSKAGVDEELKRTLEEAERRRQDPEMAKLPSPEESTKILNKARENPGSRCGDAGFCRQADHHSLRGLCGDRKLAAVRHAYHRR